MFLSHRIVRTRMQPQSPSRAMKPLARASRFSVRGFTMLELLVVLGILALLASLAISNVTGIFGGAQKDTAKIFVNQTLKTSLVSYRIYMSDYPSTAEGLQALLTPPSNKADLWQGRGPFIEGNKVPLDPWGEPYQYRYPGVKNKGGYDLWSKGADKIDGNDDDIGNWDKEAAPAAK
jgi:general secretion pathway protein G